MKLRYVVVDDIDKEVVKSFKGFISALRFAKTLEKPYIYEYKVEDNKLSILYEGNTAAFETTYTISDNKLTIKDSFGEDTVYDRK